MENIFHSSISMKLKNAGIIAVLTLQQKESVKPVIESLLEGGVTAIELTLRTPIAVDAINMITEKYPEIICGAGTVLSPQQLVRAKEAGAVFGVAPGLNRNVLNKALEENFPFAPGIATASDIEAALEFGCTLLKFFPAEPLGGLPYLKSINGPYKHLGISYIPLGGINERNVSVYAGESIINSVGGSWIAPASLIADGKWNVIKNNAENALIIYRKERI